MKKLLKLAIAVLAGTIMAAPVMAAADKPFVTVNGIVIPQATADLFMAQGKANGMPDTPEMKARVREELIRRELMFQAAKGAGFDRKPDVASKVDAATKNLLAQLEATRQTIIVRAYLDDYLRKHPVTDAQLKAAYDANRARGGNTEYKARHILVRNEADAKAIIARLDKGGNFEELARQSIEPGAAASGGDLGWASPARYVKPFGDALKGLKKGKYSATPVKSEFGYHVIRLEDTRPLEVPSFNEMKPMLHKDAEAMVVEKMLAGLRSKAKTE